MQTPEEDDVQETIPSTSVTEDSEETVLSSASSAYDCVTTGSDQTTSTTISIVPDLYPHVTPDPRCPQKILMRKNEITLMMNVNFQTILMMS